MGSHSINRAVKVIKACFYVSIVAVATLMFTTQEILVECPFAEDGYYSLTVARNLALGKGITADGNLMTNGFQPLFTFFCAPIFRVIENDKYEALRWVRLLHLIIYVATAFLFAFVVLGALGNGKQETDNLLFWFAACVYLLGINTFAVHFNGLETGCVLFFYCLGWYYYQTYSMNKWTEQVGLGIILGLTVLARSDAVFLVIVLSWFEFSST